jgi:uncharacterized protein (DUF4415 family)
MHEDDDNPVVSDEVYATARPFKEVLPDLYEAWTRAQRGRPPVAHPKQHIGFRLDADVVASIKASGKGYNARVEAVLREALAAGRI